MRPRPPKPPGYKSAGARYREAQEQWPNEPEKWPAKPRWMKYKENGRARRERKEARRAAATAAVAAAVAVAAAAAAAGGTYYDGNNYNARVIIKASSSDDGGEVEDWGATDVDEGKDKVDEELGCDFNVSEGYEGGADSGEEGKGPFVVRTASIKVKKEVDEG